MSTPYKNLEIVSEIMPNSDLFLFEVEMEST